MKRLAGAVALAMLAVATGALAQGGPINHHPTSAAGAEPPPAPPPPPPSPDIQSQLDQLKATIQTDLDQHKISRHRAVRARHEIHAVEHGLTKLDRRVEEIGDGLPQPN